MSIVRMNPSSWMRISLGLCFCFTVTSLLHDAVAEQTPTFRSRDVVESIAELEAFSLDSENGFKVLNGDSTTSSSEIESLEHDQGQRWLQLAHKFYHRVFQFGDQKPDWPELKFGWRTVTAFVFGGIGAALSSAGGIGGGGLFVPLFNLLLEYDAKTSSALSNFMILGGSLANLFINLQQHHPVLCHKPLVDFDVVMLLQPNMLLGISTGVILNVVLPDWMITALLTVTLGYMTIHSYKSALCRWKKETKQNCLRGCKPASTTCEVVQALSSEDCSNRDEVASRASAQIPTVAAADDKGDEENPKTIAISRSGLGNPALAEPLLPVEERQTRPLLPVDKIQGLSVTWVAFLAIQVFRGGKSNQSILGIPACGWGYWLLTLTQIPLALGLTGWTIIRFHAAHSSKDDPESMEEEEFVLKPESCAPLASMALIAGLLGGLLGIGGGMIINPMFLALGMLPQVTAATCASMVFFSSSMSVVQFWLMGRVPIADALTVAFLCFLFSSVGVTVVHRAINKYNRASLIVFSVATVMGVSAVLMAGFGGLSAWNNFESGAYMGFHYPC